jgi:Domain of unknown function (DUF4262)
MIKKNYKLATPESSADEKVFSNIEEYGCHVLNILEGENRPPFSFSIGLYHRFQQPEILIVGLRHDLMHPMINLIKDEIVAGKIIEPEKMYQGFLEGFDVTFRKVATAHYKDYLGTALWFYQSYDFPMLQCIWPTTDGYFPWDKNYPEDLIEWQPLLDK